MFRHSPYELSYGEEELNPLLFQDDIARVSDSVEAAQHGNELVSHVMETKLLDFNLDKSCYLVVGKSDYKKAISNQLESVPLTLSGFPMKEVIQEKYLGDYIHQNGNPESVLATIKARSGLVTSAINEIRSVLEDCRINVVGGLCAGIDIWELSVIPFLLNNSSVWADIPQAAYNQLEDLQKTFYRYLFATPISTPSPALLWETGGLTVRNRINMNKVMFFHHLMSLDEHAVASRVAKVADRAGYPGLIQEYQLLCTELGLPNPGTTSKLAWKRMVKKAIFEKNKKELLDQVERNYKKLEYEKLKEEKFEMKDYVKSMRMNDGRLHFQIRTKMVKNIAFNYSSDPKFSSQLWHCTHCDRMDSQSHVLTCESYKFLREGKDLSSDLDLVKYFRDVLTLREKVEQLD